MLGWLVSLSLIFYQNEGFFLVFTGYLQIMLSSIYFIDCEISG